MSESKDRFYFNRKTYLGTILPDRANADRSRLEGRGREQPSVGTSDTGHGLNLFAWETRLKGTERGKLGRWRRARRRWLALRAHHARESRPGRFCFLGQSGSMSG